MKKEYSKPNIELIVFNYTDVMADSGFTSSWRTSDDTDIQETGSSWITGTETEAPTTTSVSAPLTTIVNEVNNADQDITGFTSVTDDVGAEGESY